LRPPARFIPVSVTGDAPPEAPVTSATAAADGLLLSLPSFIKAPVGRTEPFFRGPVRPRDLNWSARPPAFCLSASGERGVPHLLCRFLARGHPSTEHIRSPPTERRVRAPPRGPREGPLGGRYTSMISRTARQLEHSRAGDEITTRDQFRYGTFDRGREDWAALSLGCVLSVAPLSYTLRPCFGGALAGSGFCMGLGFWRGSKFFFKVRFFSNRLTAIQILYLGDFAYPRPPQPHTSKRPREAAYPGPTLEPVSQSSQARPSQPGPGRPRPRLEVQGKPAYPIAGVG
jgi:hypothetical protein